MNELHLLSFLLLNWTKTTYDMEVIYVAESRHFLDIGRLHGLY